MMVGAWWVEGKANEMEGIRDPDWVVLWMMRDACCWKWRVSDMIEPMKFF